MSDDYEQYAEFERRQANIAAGRRPDAKPENFQEALKVAPYKSDGEPYAPKPKPTIYKDQNGKEFQFIDGQRDYLD